MRIVVLILIFGISFTQDKNIEKKESKKSKIIFSNDQSTDEYLKVFKKSLELLKTNYVDSINESEIILSGIKGMMKPLDPFTKLLMDQSKETYDHLRKGKYGGIGIQIGLRRDTLTVLGTFENSPAYSEGIQVGDNIMQIDTISTKNLTLKETPRDTANFDGQAFDEFGNLVFNFEIKAGPPNIDPQFTVKYRYN